MNSLVKQTHLERILAHREEMKALRSKEAREEKEKKRIAELNLWAKKHLYLDHDLTQEEYRELVPYAKRWHLKRLAGGVVGLGAWAFTLDQIISLAFAIHHPSFVGLLCAGSAIVLSSLSIGLVIGGIIASFVEENSRFPWFVKTVFVRPFKLLFY